MKHPLVSILIVSYNAQRYIEATVQSCLKQTYTNIEVLILDNASKDRTREIIRQLNDKRVRLIASEKNLGAYGGLNELLEKAKGEYIAIQDHDDLWLPEKLERQIEFLETHPEYSGCGTQTYYYYEGRELATLVPAKGDAAFVDHTSLVFRNTGYRYDLGYTLTDEHFEKKVLRSAGKLWCLAMPLVIHRIKADGTNLSGSRFQLNYKNLQELFALNGFSLSTLLYLANLVFARFLPEAMLWWLRRHVTLRQAKWLSQAELAKSVPFEI